MTIKNANIIIIIGDGMDTELIIENIRDVFEGEFNVGYISHKSIARHCDAFVYFVYGNADYKFNGYSFNANPENFIYLAKNSNYQIYVKEKSKFICIDFDFSKNDNNQTCSSFQINSATLKKQFTKIFFEYKKNTPESIPKTFSILYSLYSSAIEFITKKYAKQNKLVSETIAYILSNYCNSEFSIKSAAIKLGISETHLRRIFKQNFNISPIKYVNDLKLEKAKNMLCFSNYSISEIAFSVGFEDQYYFSRFFKQQLGISPSAYKKIIAKT